ncbi:MAG: hypothetical protein WAM99_06565, partial [Xanthobacteraceae bacterium]
LLLSPAAGRQCGDVLFFAARFALSPAIFRRGRAPAVFLAHSLTGMFTQLKYVKCNVSVARQEAEPDFWIRQYQCS